MGINKKINGHRKHLVFILFLLMLQVFAVQQVVFGDDLPKMVKIGLFYSSGALTDCTLESGAGFVLGTVDGDNFTQTLPLPAFVKIIATVEHDAVTLRDEEGVLIAADLANTTCIMPGDYPEGGKIKVEGKEYRGGIMFRKSTGEKLTVINYLELEEYLYGVVHLEMGQSNPLEALKAQAVTARSFTAKNLGKHSSLGFDLCNTTNCQVYGGCGAEFENTSRAVDETAGMVIWAEGKPADVYYHKNSGGYTLSIEEVWSQPASHLKGKKDEYSPNYPWTATLTFDTIAQKLSAAGYDIGSVSSVQITERTALGVVSKLTVKGEKGSAVLEKEKIRTVFGATVIRSRLFQISGEGQSIVADRTVAVKANTKSGNAGDDVYVLNSSGKSVSVKKAQIYVSNGSKVSAPSAAQSGAGDSKITGNSVVATGSGYGHGVGMSQDGAIAMAKAGLTYEDILKYYFTDIEIH